LFRATLKLSPTSVQITSAREPEEELPSSRLRIGHTLGDACKPYSKMRSLRVLHENLCQPIRPPESLVAFFFHGVCLERSPSARHACSQCSAVFDASSRSRMARTQEGQGYNRGRGHSEADAEVTCSRLFGKSQILLEIGELVTFAS